MYKRKASDKQIDEVIYKAEHDGFGLNEDELDAYMAEYPFGNGANPIGTIIAFMGNTPPMGYLACDGSEYDIVDYPKLAKFFKDQFGSTQYFGGTDDKFKVPDLRGEFLRGTGTNSHTDQGSGTDVGTHQDGTLHFPVGTTAGIGLAFPNVGPMPYTNATNQDSKIGSVTSAKGYSITGSTWSASSVKQYTSRPTNTSVLYCIKADTVTIDELDDTYLLGYDKYSPNEQIVGEWVNGKPVYQKTFTVENITVNQTDGQNILIGAVPNLDALVNATGTRFLDTGDQILPIVTSGWQTLFCSNKTTGELYLRSYRAYTAFTIDKIIATFQYTKTTDPENSFSITQLSNFKKVTNEANNYSLEEKVIGTWIDGKPLYQKTIQDTMPVVTTDGTHVNKNVTTGISNIKYIYKIDCTMIATATTGIQAISLPYITNNGYQAKIFIQDNIPVLNCDLKAYSNATVYITLQYTKTTD